MNTFVRILAGSVVGTLAMTAYSYVLSHREKKMYKEPAVLGALMGRAGPLSELVKSESLAVGWLLHYLAGLAFTAGYHAVWKKTKLKPNAASGLLLGGLNGVVGVIIWRTVFEVHPNPPRIKLKEYLGHLMGAHFVFGYFTALGYNLPPGPPPAGFVERPR